MKIKVLFLATIFASVSICWSQTRTLPVDTNVTTKHKLTTQNDSFNYTATTGTQPVWDENGDPIASLHYTYYTKDNVGNRSQRPLVISFNGGPGSGSVWMHLAYTGPRVLNIDTEGYPVQPYGIANNPYSILDVADIVYVNPVNTGYSRTIPASGKEVDRSKFFGVNADIAYLAEWLNTFVTRNNRWSSPKYLIGESYGTTRVSGLALALQNNQWMYLNGVILVSPTELGINREGPVEVANRLPYFAAAAWYQKKLPNTLQNKPLKEVLEEVEAYTINTVLPAMVMGGFLATDKKEALAEKMGYYSGIKPSVYLDHNLEIPYPYFWKELLREDGYTVGRLDSRYIGMDKKNAGQKPDYNSELLSWEHSFTPAINMYLRDELGYKTDLNYFIFGSTYPWDNTNNKTGDNLRQAMMQNPYLNLLVQSGYYDGACDYFNAKYNMWQMDPAGKIQDRMFWEGYKSGHMMYLRKEDLATSNDHLRSFIKKSIPPPGTPAIFK